MVSLTHAGRVAGAPETFWGVEFGGSKPVELKLSDHSRKI